MTVHANHAELIRAPLLFPDPGPVVCMPYILRWLKADRPTTRGEPRRPRGPEAGAWESAPRSCNLGHRLCRGDRRHARRHRRPREHASRMTVATDRDRACPPTAEHERHPLGLYILFATEMWERFGFYTAAAIMTLYLQRGGFGWSQDAGDDASGRTT